MFTHLLKKNNVSLQEYRVWKKLYYGIKPNEHEKEFYERILFILAEMYKFARDNKIFIRELEVLFSRDEIKKIRYSTENQKTMNKKKSSSFTGLK